MTILTMRGTIGRYVRLGWGPMNGRAEQVQPGSWRAWLPVVLALPVELSVWDRRTDLRWGGELPIALLLTVVTSIAIALLFRHRAPVRVFVTVWLLSLVGLAVPSYQVFVGPLLALYAVARGSDRRTSSLALVASVVPFGLVTWNAYSGSAVDVLGLAALAVLWGAFAAGVWWLGRLGHNAEERAARHAAELADAQADARRIERVRISRELHDIVAHSLSAIILQAAGARAVNGPSAQARDQVEEALVAIETAGAEAVRELHRLLGLLRDVHGGADGRVETEALRSLRELDALLEPTRRAGLRVHVERQDPASGELEPHDRTRCASEGLDPSVDHTAYRVVQETLANAMKHAGRDADVQITFITDADTLDVAVRTTTTGGAAVDLGLSGGHGLVGLAERVELVGGHLEAGPTAEGYLTVAHLPTRPRPQRRGRTAESHRRAEVPT